MSEGINFSNEMARCVVVAGLPYPDITNPELKEKMRTLDQSGSGISGQMYYQNLCMRSVNQSIGRAIRHSKDYASIVLCDRRYKEERIWRGLPEWITRDSQQELSRPVYCFSERETDIKSFFRVMSSQQVTP